MLKRLFESYFFLLQVWKTAVAFETSRVYSVVYVLENGKSLCICR